MCKVYTGYCGTSEIEHGLCACTVNNPLAKARGLSLRIGAQPMLYLPLIANIVVFWGGGGGGGGGLRWASHCQVRYPVYGEAVCLESR